VWRTQGEEHIAVLGEFRLSVSPRGRDWLIEVKKHGAMIYQSRRGELEEEKGTAVSRAR
jgi:hypothetical protein